MPADASDLTGMLRQGLDLVRQHAESPAACLLVDADLGRRLDGDVLAAWPLQTVWLDNAHDAGLRAFSLGQADPPAGAAEPLTLWTAQPAALSAEMRGVLVRFLTRARPAAQELAYLTLMGLDTAAVGQSPLRPDLVPGGACRAACLCA